MKRMLLVVNGAEYSLPAIKKAVWLSKCEDCQLDVLYVNPPCNQMYPDVPGLCFWMPDWEYKMVADRLRSKVLDEKIVPIFEESELEPRIIISSRDQDEKIKEMSEENHYDKIFIASPSKYCHHAEKGWLWFKNKPETVPSGTVCLI
ncbi:Universal stress protein family protein [Desulfotomaculum arcticum]|uniref:Universal stress protein family protein n=1 Tax=Desulfotruncus arcticus DSM 17038 TaxID=1121424 RepID=A0A1I2XF26_9FIRM|nr:universal stress protein [Desulfotruncus arcticus]SFH11657.1 Universal stress protein family protein [Desulfotomaculum arcticum] [Desulfotruncus arcticus DSM 17038]